MWWGFREEDTGYRCLRIDYNGAVGLRTVNGKAAGLPGDRKDWLRMSFRRFSPEPDRVCEFRLYSFPDSRIMLQAIDLGTQEVVWHSERLACFQESLSRMYVEVVDQPPWGKLTFDEASNW